jgi:hypothetical protein
MIMAIRPEFEEIEFCEEIGEFEEEYVYDIEVDDDTHTFIANDILVHNSLYVSFQPIMNSFNFEGDELEFILTLDRLYLKDKFKEHLDEYAAKFGVKNIHDFELETVNKSSLHVEKKHYINNVVWEDGIFFDDMSHFIPKGVEIVKSSTPPFVRGKKQKGGVWDFLNYLFRNPHDLNVRETLRIMKDLKKQFVSANLEDISFTTSLNKYNEKVIDDQSGIECVKGAHFSVKAAALHNFLLNKNPEFKTKYDLLKGGRIKWYFCNHPLNNRFAYLRSFHPYELIEKEKVIIDYDEMFNLSMLAIVNRFTPLVGLPEVNKRLSVLNSLFGGESIGSVISQARDKYNDFDDWDLESNDEEDEEDELDQYLAEWKQDSLSDDVWDF